MILFNPEWIGAELFETIYADLVTICPLEMVQLKSNPEIEVMFL